MICEGYTNSSQRCFLVIKPNSFWGLCQSCERIENRLFLEAVQKTIREDKSVVEFRNRIFSLEDPTFPYTIRNIRFNSSSKDPRLSLLALFYTKSPNLFIATIRTFGSDSTFLTSLNLLYRNHLPNKTTCGMLHQAQRRLQQRFLDLPSCPCCMSRYLIGIDKERISIHQVNHILSIFRNRILSQHPTWFVSLFKLLQTIWEQDLEDKISFEALRPILIYENPLNYQIEFRDWMAAFLETPILIEKRLMGKISKENEDFLVGWTGQTVTIPFLKKFLRDRNSAWKEDLYIKTWHPRRLFPWCLDIEELKDFGPYDPSEIPDY